MSGYPWRDGRGCDAVASICSAQVPMPAQERLWRHNQPMAAPRRQQARERRKQGTIGWPQGGATLLPSEHDKLMAQHEQLDVFSELAAPVPDQQPQYSREGEIGKGKEHAPMLPWPAHRGPREREFLVWARSPSLARPSAIWYSRARVKLTRAAHAEE